MDGAGTINDNRSKRTKGKIDMIVRERQIDANSEIYYAIPSSENGISTCQTRKAISITHLSKNARQNYYYQGY